MIDKLVDQSIKYTKILHLVLVQRQNDYATSSTYERETRYKLYDYEMKALLDLEMNKQRM